MSNSANPRSAPNHDRRTSATASAKPRVPSSRTGTRGRPGSSGEVQPDDSASNAPHRRNPSGAERANGSTWTTTERQTARVNVTTRENVQLRKWSPVKGSAVNDKGGWHSEARKPQRLGSPTSEALPSPGRKEKEKEPPRGLSAWRNSKLTWFC